MAQVLDHADVQSRPSLAGWQIIDERLVATFRTKAMPRGVELVRRVVDEAEDMNHHPDVDLRYARVHVALVTHSAGGITERDVALAERVSTIATELEAPVEPARPRGLQIAIDATDIPAVVPFWRAVLGHRPVGGTRDDLTDVTELSDPDGRLPGVWFQQMDAPRPGRGRIHLDVHVPHEQAEARVAAALEAGGHVVSDVYSPSWWVLADAEGNEACVCTWREHD
ncbi:VOC family protein [Georgenia halophila]|uniref:Putative pterin-4-alpha-carbinolamine dehydratase n=1 Tax=Georgenia halophila TaxID=620889 RepID=A0ABP8LII6_9MICO